jgi:enterochelin esterase-like enzyme
MRLILQLGLLMSGILCARGNIVFEGKVWSESLQTNRFVRIYLPPSYADSTERYPVLYVHDGQNAFTTAGPHAAFGWGNWELDKTADRLTAEKKIRPIIMVAIDCGASRYREYRGPVPGNVDNNAYQRYSRFLIDELKPKIDREYRTLTDAANTGALGSSMGGICSLALAWEHPNVFGLAASISGAFQVEKQFFVDKVLHNYSGKPKQFRAYLDSGITDYTGGDDGAKLTESVADELRRIGWKDGANLLHFVDQPLTAEQLTAFNLAPEKFSEAQRSQHNEFYWRLRAWRALAFLFPTADEKNGPAASSDRKSRRAILAAMQEVMGPLPGAEKRCPLDARITETVDCGDYLRHFLTYQSEPDSRVPAYLLVPKAVLASSEKAPAILCLHQTHKMGQKVVVGLGESPNDEYGVELVKRGYVCFAPPYPLLADYAPDLKKLGYASGSMKAIWDNIRALDYLESLPYVKKGAFAAIGHSLGGHNSLYTAAFDERIKVVVTSCGFDSFRDYMDGNIKGWTSERYMPRLLNYPLDRLPFDFDDVLTAIAPRSIFINAPTGDTNFKWESIDRIIARVRPIYEESNASANLTVEHPNVAHSFPPQIRHEAYELIDRVLRP